MYSRLNENEKELDWEEKAFLGLAVLECIAALICATLRYFNLTIIALSVIILLIISSLSALSSLSSLSPLSSLSSLSSYSSARACCCCCVPADDDDDEGTHHLTNGYHVSHDD